MGGIGQWQTTMASNKSLQADVNKREIIVQGREDEDQWVTSYKVQTSLDGTSWNFVPGTDSNGGVNEEEVSCFLLHVYNNVCFIWIITWKLVSFLQFPHYSVVWKENEPK